jgi:hypothetical protein
MKTFISILPIIVSVLLVSSCARKDSGPATHATVYLRDGSQYAGTVTSSSAAEITLAGDDKSTRTIAMKDVKSVEYDDPAAQAQTQPPPAPEAPLAQTQPPPAAEPPPTQMQRPPATPPLRRREPDLSHERHYHPDAEAVTTRSYEVPAGADLTVRTEETIDSAHAVEGQTFAAEVTNNVLDNSGAVVIPRGANAQIIIRSASQGGRFRGSSDLVLDLASISVGGRRYQVSTADLVKQGKSGIGANQRTAKYGGGGAAIGAIIGAIAGGGKGAAIGAGSGAAAGAVTQVITKGAIRIPVESLLTFRLDRPLRIVAAR